MSHYEKLLVSSVLSSLIVDPTERKFSSACNIKSFDHVHFDTTKFPPLILASGLHLLPNFSLLLAQASGVTFNIPWNALKTRPVILNIDSLEITVDSSQEQETPHQVNTTERMYCFLDRLMDSIVLTVSELTIRFKSDPLCQIKALDLRTSPCSHNFQWPQDEEWSTKDIQMKGKSEIILFRMIRWASFQLTVTSANGSANLFQLIGENVSHNLTMSKSLIGPSITKLHFASTLEHLQICIDLRERLSLESLRLLNQLVSALFNLNVIDINESASVRKPFNLSLRTSSSKKACENILYQLHKNYLSSKLTVNCLNFHVVDTAGDSGIAKCSFHARVEGVSLSTDLVRRKLDSIEESKNESAVDLVIDMKKLEILFKRAQPVQPAQYQEPFFIVPFLNEAPEPLEGSAVTLIITMNASTIQVKSLQMKIGPSRISCDTFSILSFLTIVNRVSCEFFSHPLAKWNIDMTLPIMCIKEKAKLSTLVRAGRVNISSETNGLFTIAASPLWTQRETEAGRCTISEPVLVKATVQSSVPLAVDVVISEKLTLSLAEKHPFILTHLMNVLKEFKKSLDSLVKNQNARLSIKIDSLYVWLATKNIFTLEKKSSMVSESASDRKSDVSTSSRQLSQVEKRESETQVETIVNEFKRNCGLEIREESESLSSRSVNVPGDKESDGKLSRVMSQSSITKESTVSVEHSKMTYLIGKICSGAKIHRDHVFSQLHLDRMTLQVNIVDDKVECTIQSKGPVHGSSTPHTQDDNVDGDASVMRCTFQVKLAQRSSLSLNVNLIESPLTIYPRAAECSSLIWQHLMRLCEKTMKNKNKTKGHLQVELDNSTTLIVYRVSVHE